jgi:hypothetical protein
VAITAGPWTIKSVSTTTRLRANKAAAQADLTMGDWIALAVERQAAYEDGITVIPPVGQDRRPTSSLSLGDVAAALAAMSAAAGQGLPVSRGAVRDTVRLIQTEVRAARGLPTGRTRQTIGQTATIEAGRTPEGVDSLTPDDSETA